MKKTYEKPTAEKIEFKYRDQVVVASSSCNMQHSNKGVYTCENGWIFIGYVGNQG